MMPLAVPLPFWNICACGPRPPGEMNLSGACPCPHCGSLYQLGDSQEILDAAEPQLMALYAERLPAYEGRRLVRVEELELAEQQQQEEGEEEEEKVFA